jgi:cytochrome P450
MTLKNYEEKGDFLSLMLTDDLFKGKDQYIIDECLTFMLAGTMTTTLLISNAIYHLTANRDKLDKLRSELSKYISR